MGGTISEKLSSLPEYFEYVIPVIEVQKELGGSAKPAKVLDRVIDKIGGSNAPFIQPKAPPCPTKIGSEMPKVRQVLIHAGLLDPSRKGVWKLTEKALETDPSDIDLHHLNELRKRADKEYRGNRKRKINEEGQNPEAKRSLEEAIFVRDDYRRRLLEQLKTLSPADLEKVCQEVLRRSGFERVAIIGQGNEDCFEGECIFQENSLMRSYVMFQFKCVDGLIGAEEIRDFRSAMTRRAEKGIFMSICSFTASARLEAQRDGVFPVVLIDGNKLVGMIEKFKIRLETA